MKRRSLAFAAGCMLAAGASIALRPTVRASEVLSPIDLDAQIPLQFGGWKVDASILPVLPDPSVQARLNQIYTQVLARTYVRTNDQRVMLSIAYGADQGSDATSAHRPEFCYTAQGFIVTPVREEILKIGEHRVVVRRLVGRIGSRFEPITYWVTLNDRTVLPGVRRKLEQLRLGLLGQIPDGMLMRTSTVGMDLATSFVVQDIFLQQLNAALQPNVRDRYFGGAA